MSNWRNAFKSDFLASWDLDKNVFLTIKNVEVKNVQLAKLELKVVANFIEPTFENGEKIKPMILNATNCKLLNLHTGTKETNDWNNIKVEIGVKANTGRIGGANGLSIIRIFPNLDKPKPFFTEDKIKSTFEKGITIEKIKEVYQITAEVEAKYKSYGAKV